MVKQGGKKTFTELVELAGLKSPFDEETISSIAKTASDWLSEFDSTKLK